MDDDNQRMNPMAMFSEMAEKMFGSGEDSPMHRMFEQMQDAGARAQEAQASFFGRFRDAGSFGGGGFSGLDSSSEDSGDQDKAMDELQSFFEQMTQPWSAFLQMDRRGRLRMLRAHRRMVGAYLDQLDSAIETLEADVEAADDSES